MKFTKKTIYIGLFAILYLIVAFSSFWHACAFFGLANNSWMSIILAFAFEVGQAAVLFSLLTSKKDRSRIMPWVLMTMFTLVQVIGNVFSSYKYLITNSVENLRYFKEPIFIWTDLPDDQATVIITYVVGAILPVAALLLTSMITNYLTDEDDEKKEAELKLIPDIVTEKGPNTPIELKNEEEFIDLYNDGKEPKIETEENPESEVTKDPQREDNEAPSDTIDTITPENNDDKKQVEEEINEKENFHQPSVEVKEEIQKPSHFINF